MLCLFFVEDKSIKNAWDDEEDEGDVKDDWDAPDPEPVKSAPKPVVVSKVTKTTKVKKAVEDMTEEEKKEAQMNADFEHAKELLGLEESLDEISLETKDDYRNYIQRLMLKLHLFQVSSGWVLE
jgi:hypothetical protein